MGGDGKNRLSRVDWLRRTSDAGTLRRFEEAELRRYGFFVSLFDVVGDVGVGGVPLEGIGRKWAPGPVSAAGSGAVRGSSR